MVLEKILARNKCITFAWWRVIEKYLLLKNFNSSSFWRVIIFYLKTHNAISNIADHSKMFFLSSLYYKNISLALSTSSILHTWSFFFFFQNNLHFFTYIVECFIQTHLISHSFLYVYRHLFFCFVLPFIRLLISCVCNTERNSYDAYIYCPKKTEVKCGNSAHLSEF